MKKENIPNILTLGRIVFIPIFILLLSFGSSPLLHKMAAVVFAIASITDYLDGYLARKWQVVGHVSLHHVGWFKHGSILASCCYHLS